MNKTAIDNFIKNRIESLSIPYFEIAVKKDEKVIYSYSFASEDKNNHLLNMYSMSKPITAVAVMQLIKAGKLSFEDNVSDYLDGFNDLFIISSKEKVNVPISIKHCLTMTSGLDYNLERKAVIDLINKNPDADTISVCSRFAKDGISFIPGTNFQYSLSFDVLAAIVEKATGLKFSEYVEKNIFIPLGMNNSTFRHDNHLSSIARHEYIPFEDKLSPAKCRYNIFSPTINYESGGAGLISTVDDYSKFIDFLANGNDEVLTKDYIDLIDEIYVKDTPFNDSVKEYSKSNKEYGYGLGVRVRKIDSINGIPAGEFGWDGAAGSYCLIDRKNHISIVMGLTVFNWPTYLSDFHLSIANKIYEEIYKK